VSELGSARRSAVALVVAIVCAVAAIDGCADRALGAEEARLTVPDGAQVRVLEVGGAWEAGTTGQVLRRGDRVEVRRGIAELTLARDRRIELRPLPQAEGQVRADLEIAAVPRLRSGEALMVAKATSLTVAAADAEAKVVAGAGRISRVLGNAIIASYEGSSTVTSARRTLKVPALRQSTVVTSGLVPQRPSPLRYDADDPFDRRYLGSAIALGEELDARVRGLTDNLQLAPDEGHTPGFYRELVPALELEDQLPALLEEVDGKSRLGAPEKLVGAVIAAQSRRGPFASRWRATFVFRAEGADWGLVALDQRVARTPLLRDIDTALGRRELTPIASPARPAASLRPAPTAPVTPGPGRSPSSSPASSPPPATAGPSALPSSPLLDPPPLIDEPVPVVDVVDDVLNRLLGGLGP
jgi:hypothetical protein